MLCLKLFDFKHGILELYHLEVYCRTTFFSKQCCSNIKVGCYCKAKIETFICTFQQSTMYKIPPVFSYHSFKINSDQLYLDIEEYLQENI